MSFWFPEAPGPQARDIFFLRIERDVSMEITDQKLAFIGCLLVRDNLDISHMLVEAFMKEHISNLSPSFALGEGDQVIGSLFKTGVTDDHVAGHGKLQ